MSDVETAVGRALAGGPERHRAKAAEQGKLPVRERVARLLDEGSFVEEGLLANATLFFNAGRLDRSMELDTKDWMAVVKPRLARIAAPT